MDGLDHTVLAVPRSKFIYAAKWTTVEMACFLIKLVFQERKQVSRERATPSLNESRARTGRESCAQ